MEKGIYKRKVLIHGWGINDSDYVTQRYFTDESGIRRSEWKCPIYSDWMGMLRRCYCKSYKAEVPTYSGCTITEEWKYFSNFKQWVESQPNKDWQNCDLDKDILVNGNKVYSPDTCVYVSKQINILFRELKVRDLPDGVYKKGNRFAASTQDYFTSKLKHLGSFGDVASAEKCVREYRHNMYCKIADTQSDQRIAEVLRNKYVIF